MRKLRTNGILLLYSHDGQPDASTILEHIAALKRHSRFSIWSVNTRRGFPAALEGIEFQAIVLHYSTVSCFPYPLGEPFIAYLGNQRSSYKVAFFQDEYHFCPQRFALLNALDIDCVYTLLETEHVDLVYRKHTKVRRIVHNLTGYVGEELLSAAAQFARPEAERSIDIGYRGRQLPFYMGQGAQEKHLIATGFLQRAEGLGLSLNIKSGEAERLYGEDWHAFTGNCRAFLGVEAGVSIFDLEGDVQAGYQRLIAEEPNITFEEMSRRWLHRWEGNVPYRTISPRHFEAAAFRVCQILFEGRYSGVLRPLVHYIPLRKDFSNFDEVIRMFRDPGVRQELVENAHRDLIASGSYSYKTFVAGFDRELRDAGLEPEVPDSQGAQISGRLRRAELYHRMIEALRPYREIQFPVRRYMRRLVGRL